MREDYLVLTNLIKHFGKGSQRITAVDNVNIKVKEGELVTLLGPSGCGKTTTLRMIAGFEDPDEGDILIDSVKINSIPPNQRPTSLVFQNYALFPHMSVKDNISYGLKINHIDRNDIKRRTAEIINLVGLNGMENRSPAQLSGGQQQRVSLARSIVMEPKVLLLDEPLSNLDAKLRVSMRLEIRKIQQRVGITSIYVTHDQEEAMTLSDRVVIMNEGKVQQEGTPEEIYAHPVNLFVADFIGKANFLPAKVNRVYESKKVDVELFRKRLNILIPFEEWKFRVGSAVLVVIRPEGILVKARGKGDYNGTVKETVYLGSKIIYDIAIDSELITAEIPNPEESERFKVGDIVGVSFKEHSLHILPAEK
ncbi:MAG: ABC transporter ATP-binding protein [Spirochaetes bacterium]|nr:MAG: ABC transporter ATP-binding protein [Spirochaetota bacterium]